MSRGSEHGGEMRPEYDIRGGTRGKYLERYRQTVNTTITVTFEGWQAPIAYEGPAVIAASTAAAAPVGAITRPASFPSLYPSLEIKIGTPLP